MIRAALLALLLLPAPSAAHDRTTSYSTWDIRGDDADVRVTLSALDLTRFAWAGDAARVADYLTSHLRLRAGTALCRVNAPPRALDAEPGRVVYEWRLACPPGPLTVESDLLGDVASGHLHFARVERAGAPHAERVLSESAPTWALDAPAAAARPYLWLGVEHILTGWDHLAFLLALLLLGASLLEVARMVTGFTIAHSVTLAAAALGLVQPARAPIEALIGLSIALVAAENVWLVGGRRRLLPAVIVVGLGVLALLAGAGHGRLPPLTLAGLALFAASYFGLAQRTARPATLRAAAAFVFGLVHGLGFASVLVEAHLQPAHVVRALLGFNVGVEVGQLAVVAVAWPALRLVVGRRALAVELASAAVGGLGVFWFVARAYR